MPTMTYGGGAGASAIGDITGLQAELDAKLESPDIDGLLTQAELTDQLPLVFLDAAARAAALAGYTGQLGFQEDTGALYFAIGLGAGEWVLLKHHIVIVPDADSNSTITPLFVGQLLMTEDTGALYVAISTDEGDWVQVGGSGTGTAVYADTTELNAATPAFIGQLALQVDTGVVYRGTGLGEGSWEPITTTRVFADDAAREAAFPATIGILGLQVDTGDLYRSIGTNAGDWTPVTLSSLTDGTNTVTLDQIRASIAQTSAINQTQVISGGSAVWKGTGLVYLCSQSTYIIGGVTYTAPAAEITLDAADGTNPRIDRLVLNTSSVWAKVTGTAAATPLEPAIDPETQIVRQFAYVLANATTPDGVTSTNIYQDDATYWTASVSGASVNKASTSNPKSGTKCVEGTTVTTGHYAEFDKGSDYDHAGTTALNFFLRLKASLVLRSLTVTLRNSAGTQVGNPVVVARNTFGLDEANTTTYQQVTIPWGAFGLTSLSVIRKLRITASGSGTFTGFYIDEITTQSGDLTGAQAALQGIRGNTGLFTAGSPNDVVEVKATHGLKTSVSGNVLTIAPGVVQITDQATLAVDATGISYAYVTLGAQRAFGVTTGTTYPGQALVIEITCATFDISSWHADYLFPGGVEPVLSGVCLVPFRRNAANTKWIGGTGPVNAS